MEDRLLCTQTNGVCFVESGRPGLDSNDKREHIGKVRVLGSLSRVNKDLRTVFTLYSRRWGLQNRTFELGVMAFKKNLEWHIETRLLNTKELGQLQTIEQLLEVTKTLTVTKQQLNHKNITNIGEIKSGARCQVWEETILEDESGERGIKKRSISKEEGEGMFKN